ncbi:(2Fe-2S)-binding protein [Candidatus Peregrinibacteria bacterium]|nr:MAG: (2Fe-2S)-binding protein [Candidatus Peregrinibacteria bacterium]
MITCIINDSDGNELGTFHPKGEKNLLDEAADEGIEIPFSCHAGACMSCAAQVVQGMDLVDEERDGPKYIDTTDEDIILTCIASVDPEKATDKDRNYILEIDLAN